jgi:hypothetical protein
VEIIGLGLVTDGQGGMAAASVSLSRAAKLRKRVILSARPARPAGSRRTFFMDNARRPEGIVLVAVSLLRGGVSCNKGCIGWTTIP